VERVDSSPRRPGDEGRSAASRADGGDAPVLELTPDAKRLEKVEQVGLSLAKVAFAVSPGEDRDRVDAVVVETRPGVGNV